MPVSLEHAAIFLSFFFLPVQSAPGMHEPAFESEVGLADGVGQRGQTFGDRHPVAELPSGDDRDPSISDALRGSHHWTGQRTGRGLSWPRESPDGCSVRRTMMLRPGLGHRAITSGIFWWAPSARGQSSNLGRHRAVRARCDARLSKFGVRHLERDRRYRHPRGGPRARRA